MKPFIGTLALRGAIVALLFLVSRAAYANPRPLPFTYTYETLGQGDTEVEQYFDFVPLRSVDLTSGAQRWYGATQFQTEVEFGLTNRLELALYAVLAPTPGESLTQTASLTETTGVKQRLRYRIAEQGQLPVDIGLYAEVVENTREFELEGKLILVKRFGDLRIAANLWFETEFYFKGERELVLNPTLGITYQVTPGFHLGLDSWMRKEIALKETGKEEDESFNGNAHVYAGPGLLFNFGRVWWANALYTRFDDFGRTMKPGDSFGNVWFRSIVGVEL
ncbi:MAG: hypothetical protein HOO96_36715 [Polyangiaceae bacterium]|nr:hypothetical protein [Polyangiaceae bacterium]